MDQIVRAKDLGNTVILNVYKRPEYLQEQIEALISQTYRPTQVWAFYSGYYCDPIIYHGSLSVFLTYNW